MMRLDPYSIYTRLDVCMHALLSDCTVLYWGVLRVVLVLRRLADEDVYDTVLKVEL